MSITDAGWPSAAARLTRRPSASRNTRRSSDVELLDHRPGDARRRCQLAQRRDVDLDVEMAGVGEDRPVLHDLEVLAPEHVLVARRGHEHVALDGGVGHREHPEAVHHRLQRPQRVDLDHHHVGAQAPRAVGDAAAAPAVAADDEAATREQDVGRPQDAVEGRLAGAVAVVEKVLGVGLVDRHDRIPEHAVGLHRAQPDDAGRRLLRTGGDLAEQSGCFWWIVETTSQPSSMVTFGRWAIAASMCS